MQAEQKACKDEEGLFKILNKKFKPVYNETIKSLQFNNLVRWHNKSVKNGWVGIEQQLWNATIKKYICS